MWQRKAWFAAWMLAHAAVVICPAQDCPPAGSTAPERFAELGAPGPLPTQCPAVRFELVMGRLTAIHLSAGQHQLNRQHETECALRETLQVHCEPSGSRVRYERHTATGSTTIEFTDSVSAAIRTQPLDPQSGTAIDLRQSPSGELTLKIAQGDQVRELAAASFWHLLLAERQLCEQEIVPLLQLLRSTWDLADAADRIERSLFRAAHTGPPVPRSRAADLVADLAHPSFQRRQAADRELRSLGPAVLVYLSTLDATHLTCEQRQRIRQIRDSMANATVDTPERVALWLVDDERIWITLLAHPDAEKRHLALLQLRELRPDITSFDPYGDELYRQKQLAQLRVALIGR